MTYDLDQEKITANRQAYRRLSPAAIAELDENRHQLSGEEATALDDVMADPDLAPRIAEAIEHLDAVKRRSFRLRLLEYPLGAAAYGYPALLPTPWNIVGYIVVMVGGVCYGYFIRPRLLERGMKTFGRIADVF